MLEFEASRNIKVYSERETGARTPEESLMSIMCSLNEISAKYERNLIKTKRKYELLERCNGGRRGEER